MGSGNPISPRTRKIIWTVLAFVFWGVWAAWVNWDHGVAAGLKAGGTQGLMSAVMAVLMTNSMEILYKRGKTRRVRYLRAAFGTFVGQSTLLICAHLIAGTPELIVTVSLPLVVSLVFCLGYTARLSSLDTVA